MTRPNDDWVSIRVGREFKRALLLAASLKHQNLTTYVTENLETAVHSIDVADLEHELQRLFGKPSATQARITELQASQDADSVEQASQDLFA